MRYILKQKVFSIGDAYIIRDEFDNERFRVQGKIFSLRAHLFVQDNYGKEIFSIKEKFSFLKRYFEIYKNEELFAILKKDSFWRPVYSVEQNSTQYKITGRIWQYEYDISKSNKLVAKISKKIFSLSDTYSVEVFDDEDPAFIISMVICIDKINESYNQQSANISSFY